MFKFLHAADIHLDSPLRGLERYEGAPVEQIRQASRRALANLVELAFEESVAFVLIAGDLYDGDWKDYSTGLFFASEMAKLRDLGVPVYLVAGNHDAANRMTRSLQLPENVRVFSTERPETFSLEKYGVAVHGQGFARAAVTDNLAVGFPDATPGFFNIGLLHTCATGYEGHERYAPCALADLLEKEYDYWALGHVHKRAVLHEDPWIVFPGNIQGRHIKEPGSKGCTLVEVEEDRVASARHCDLDVVRWQVCDVDATPAASAYDVADLFEERACELLEDSGLRPLALRVEISGSSAAHAELAARSDHWIQEIRCRANNIRAGDVWVEKVRVKTSGSSRPGLNRVRVEEDRVSGGARDSGDVDGDDPGHDSRNVGADALGELAELLRELRSDDGRLSQLSSVLEPLRKKLPSSLRFDDNGLPFDSLENLRGVLDGIDHLLRSRLYSGEERE